MPWVYIIECSDGSYYTGSTPDLDRRFAEHQQGVYGGYTASRRPLKLVFCEETETMDEAFRLERQIKGWSRRKKQAVIKARYNLLPELSRSRGPRAR